MIEFARREANMEVNVENIKKTYMPSNGRNKIFPRNVIIGSF